MSKIPFNLKHFTKHHQLPDNFSITICGGGNAAHASAAYLGSKPELCVRVLTRHPGLWRHEIVLNTEGTSWNHKGNILGKLANVSDQPQDVIPMAHLILVAAPAHCHRDILKKIHPHVTPGTLLGCLFGQGGFDWAVQQCFPDALEHYTIFGFQNIPWICHTLYYGHQVQLLGPKKCLAVTTLPASHKEEFAALASFLFDIPCTTVPNFLCLTLSPSNQIIHPARYYALFGDWDGKSPIPREHIQWGLYTDFDDRSAEILTQLDEELQHIKHALLNHDSTVDLSSVLPVKERIVRHYGSDVADTTSLKKIMQSNRGYAGCKTPLRVTPEGYFPDVNSRLFWEDIPFGLCILKAIAQMTNVQTPMIDQVILWHQKLMGKNYLLSQGTLNPSLLHEMGVPEANGFLTVTNLLAAYRNT